MWSGFFLCHQDKCCLFASLCGASVTQQQKAHKQGHSAVMNGVYQSEQKGDRINNWVGFTTVAVFWLLSLINLSIFLI